MQPSNGKKKSYNHDGIWPQHTYKECPDLQGEMGHHLWCLQKDMGSHGVMCQNEDFWSMCAAYILASNLFKLFNKSIFKMIDSFMNRRPIFKSPHSHDLMDPNDNIYTTKSILHNHNSLIQDDFNPFTIAIQKP